MRACDATPGGSAYVGSVGATDIDDFIAVYSNTCKCNNLYAPGSDMDSGYQKISGTSMACPIRAGAVAQYLQYNQSLTTYDATDTLYRSCVCGDHESNSTESA